MNENRAAEILAAHADGLIGRPDRQINATDREAGQLAPLFQLAGQLHHSMPPVQPSRAFVRSLGQQLRRSAERQVALTRRARRGILIGAAAVGSLVSVASVVGAIVYMVGRSRARTHTHTAHAPMG